MNEPQMPLIVPRIKFIRASLVKSRSVDVQSAKRTACTETRQLPLIVPRMKFFHPLVVKLVKADLDPADIQASKNERTTASGCTIPTNGKNDKGSRYAAPQTLTWNGKIPKPQKPSFTVKVELLKRDYPLIEIEKFRVRKCLCRIAFTHLT